jgi:molecular chaperone HtpG
MLEPDIERLKQTALFKKLCEKEESLKDHEISEKIISVIKEIIPLLARIPENMREFTLHDANHSAKVVELMGKIIPSDTFDRLNTIELSILIYAAYLHDVGMTASLEEREEIIKNDPEFTKLFISNEELSHKLDEAKKCGDHRIATFIEDRIFCEFLRRKHVERSRKLIIEKYGSEETPISWKGTPYYKLVQLVCDSHGLPIRDLYNTNRWRRDSLIKDQSVNLQYLSVILRLADILDLDPERTPKCLLDFINPTDETSIKEWKKHLSIVGCKINQKEIRIEAECEHPIYQRTLLEFIDMIETERKESIYLTAHYKDDLAETYFLDLTEPIMKDYIKSNGEYIYSDFHFKLDFHRIIDLLMGERLYGDPSLTLRELLQNSVDAVRYRQSMEKKEENSFEPFIKITLKADELIFEDNGVGMDEHIFENYFMQIGRSYYNSSEYRMSGIEIDPVSEFGIGILSVFMVASKIRVESRRKPIDPLHPTDSINIEIPTAYDYFVRRPSLRSDIGTKIILSLKPNHPFSSIILFEEISKIAPFIDYAIDIETDKKIDRYIPSLPGDMIHDGNNIKEYFEVTFDDIEGIEGKLLVCSSSNRHIVFAQKGFIIPYKKLLPYDIFGNLGAFLHIKASINLSNQYKITLSPNRSDIVKDERYKVLIERLQYKIIETFESYLKILKNEKPIEEYIKYINEFLNGYIFSFSDYDTYNEFTYLREIFKDKFKDIFVNYFPLLTISNDGQRSYKTMKNLNATRLAIVDINDWTEKIPDAVILKEAKRLVGVETVLMMHEEEGRSQRDEFLKHILGNFSEIYITSIPGVVIATLHNDKANEGTFLINNREFTYRMHSDPIKKAPLFVHPPGFDDERHDTFSHSTNFIFNAHHPLIKRLLDGKKPKDKNSLNALNLLINKIEKCLFISRDKAYAFFSKRNRELDESANINYMLIGILKYHSEIFQELSQAVELYWEEATGLGVISRNEKFIGFSFDDLPWFWNCDLNDFKLEYLNSTFL